MTPWIIIVALAFGAGILAGMSMQWRRDKAHVERLEAERDYLRVEVADLTDGDWVYDMEASVDKYLTRQAPGAGERVSDDGILG